MQEEIVKKKFYVTTPIYYVTAQPHLGSLYSTLIADAVIRWHALLGEQTFFVTGTDEHGQKVAQAAQEVGKDPQNFVDGFIPAYKDVWQKYDTTIPTVVPCTFSSPSSFACLDGIAATIGVMESTSMPKAGSTIKVLAK